MPKLPLVGTDDSGRIKDINSRRCVNLMPHVSNTGAKENLYWVSSPGTTLHANIAGVARGFHEWNDKGYFVAGTTLYSVDSAGTVATLASGIAASNNTVSFQNNDWQLGFVQGDSHIYVWDGTNFDDITKWSGEYNVTAIVKSGAGPYTYTVTTSTAYVAVVGDKVIFKGIGSTFFDNAEFTIATTPDTTHFTFTSNTSVTVPSIVAGAKVFMQDTAFTITPATMTFMDSYGIINNTYQAPDKSVVNYDFFVSASNDFRIWKASATGAAEREPDALVNVTAFQGDLWLFGAKSTETYFNSANDADQPFAPTRPSALQWGCAAPHSVQQVSGGLCFLGVKRNGQPTVCMSSGYEIKPVATDALEYRLLQYTKSQLANATAFAYRSEGKEYYCLTFGTETWVFDPASSAAGGGLFMWHERQDYTGGAARPKYYSFVDNKHLVTDRTDATILVLTRDAVTEWSGGAAQNVSRYGVSGFVHGDEKGVFHYDATIDMQHPVGSGTINLSWSDDGGNTFSTPVGQAFTGLDTRVQFFGLGFSRNQRCYKVEATADVPVNINTAYIRAEQASW